jgi:membrane protein required for beta-lactamase induction
MGVKQTMMLIQTTGLTEAELLVRSNELLAGIEIFLHVIVWILFMIPVAITAYLLYRMIMRWVKRSIKLPM